MDTPTSLADRSRARRLDPRGALSLVAVLLIAVLGAWNIGLQQQASEASRRADELRTAIAVTADPTARLARLAGGPTAPGVGGFAAFRTDGTGVLVVEGLAPAPAGRSYQAWYVAGGQARSAGLVRVEKDGLIVATDLRPGGPVDAVALTLEAAGGAQQPTETPRVVGAFT